MRIFRVSRKTVVDQPATLISPRVKVPALLAAVAPSGLAATRAFANPKSSICVEQAPRLYALRCLGHRNDEVSRWSGPRLREGTEDFEQHGTLNRIANFHAGSTTEPMVDADVVNGTHIKTGEYQCQILG